MQYTIKKPKFFIKHQLFVSIPSFIIQLFNETVDNFSFFRQLPCRKALINNSFLTFLYFLCTIINIQAANAQQLDTYYSEGYKLTFVHNDPFLNHTVKEQMVDVFFKIYPALVHQFNRRAAKEVIFVVDTAYTAVAEASGNHVIFSAGYIQKYPCDIDMVTHEIMHLVQAYPHGTGPWWVTEGIADYVRYAYGINNEAAGWSLIPYKDGHHYSDGYRITAHFFLWIEKHVKSGTLKKLDDVMRSKSYTEHTWKELTGINLDELWNNYVKDSTI